MTRFRPGSEHCTVCHLNHNKEPVSICEWEPLAIWQQCPRILWYILCLGRGQVWRSLCDGVSFTHVSRHICSRPSQGTYPLVLCLLCMLFCRSWPCHQLCTSRCLVISQLLGCIAAPQQAGTVLLSRHCDTPDSCLCYSAAVVVPHIESLDRPACTSIPSVKSS